MRTNWIDFKDARYCEGCALATLARGLGRVECGPQKSAALIQLMWASSANLFRRLPHFLIFFREESLRLFRFEVEGTANANADIVLDHEVSESFSVDQKLPATKVSGENRRLVG